MAGRTITKPHVICHMCTTVDGKILGDRWGKLPGGKTNASLFETTADSFNLKAWVVGTTTMDEFDGKKGPLAKAKGRIARTDHVADPRARRFGIGADAKGVLRFKSGQVEGDHIVLLVTERVSADYLAHLQKAGVSYVFCGARAIDLPVAMEKLRRLFGLKKLMLQGGGRFNGAMLAAGLVDEISQVIPIADGGVGVSSFFDIPGDAPPRKAAAHLKLRSLKKLPGGVVWLRYAVR
jgi:2,5-diamino-6-(ribosylamino)-4(3H)-pyrimidinone 5'-phosphate reductase